MLFDKRCMSAGIIWIAAVSPALAAPAKDIPSTVNSALPATQSTVFTTQEKQVICRFFDTPACQRILDAIDNAPTADEQGKSKKGKHKDALLPPGLAKRDTLPPGLQRQLERNGKLPPGLEKRALPDDLLRALPVRHSDLDRVIVDNDVLLIRRGTDLILDILENAVGPAR